MYRPRDRSNEWFYRQTCRFLVFLQVCLICIFATKRQKHTHCKNRRESWRVYTIRALLINTRDSITQMPMMINVLSTLWPTTGIWTCLTVIALGPCWINTCINRRMVDKCAIRPNIVNHTVAANKTWASLTPRCMIHAPARILNPTIMQYRWQLAQAPPLCTNAR